MQQEAITEHRLRLGTGQLAERDPDLHRIVTRLGYPPMWNREPGFASLVHIILEQQISIKAAATVFRRLDSHLGGLSPESVLRAGQQGLRQFGLTKQKARYCVELASRIASGQLDLADIEKREDDTGRRDLLAVPGLGPWTVDIYFMTALRRPDVWPSGDLALAWSIQDIKQLHALPTKTEQLEIASQWSPWRAVAARLLWMHYLDVKA